MGKRKHIFDLISLVITKGVRVLQTSSIMFGLAFAMILLLGNAKVVHAAEVVNGEGWTLDDSGTLTILYDIPLNMETRSFEWVPYAGQIKEVIASEGVTEIPTSAFASTSVQYNSLQKLTLSSTVKKIGNSAFYQTARLAEINLNEGLTEIGQSAFAGSCITEIKLPSTLTEIGGDAFTCCDRLTSITIPSNVKYLYNATFFDCTSLTDVTIEEGMESIGKSIFGGCTNLKYVTIPKSVTEIFPTAFQTQGLCIIGYPGTTAEDFTKTEYAKNRGITFQAIEGIAYEIIYELNKGTNNSKNPDRYTGETAITLYEPTRTGYTFEGWYTDGSFKNKVSKIPKGTTGNVTLYAKWTNKYTVTFNVKGGKALSKSNQTKTVTYGKTYGALPKAVRKGYTFKGWYTKTSGGTKVTTTKTVTASKAQTLYAQWTKVTKPGKVTTNSVKNSKAKQITVKVKKVSGAKGYQILYSTNKNFKSAKKTTTTSLSKTVKGLKKGKTYYVKIRAYKLDSMENKIYGAYSTVEKVTVKK